MLLTVLLHCHCQYNNSHDSHQDRLHCRHQIRHIRELKSYTIIFHIISNQISTTETNYRKKQTWQKWSVLTKYIYHFTKMQMLILFFCLVFVLFSSQMLARKGAVFTSLLPSVVMDLIQVSLSFWTLSRAKSTYSTVEHCRARWQLLAGGHRITGATRHKQPQHTQRHGLFNKHADTTW